MSTYEEASGGVRVVAPAEPVAIEVPKPPPPPRFENAWRHAVAIGAIVIALFPVLYIASAAFNADASLTGSSIIPSRLTFDNFKHLFSPPQTEAEQLFGSARYLRWYVNTLLVATVTSVATVLLGALAAYAFSRFRFRGRRFGMLFLLLVQMFPQILLIVAIYLIVLNTGDVFPAVGLNTLLGADAGLPGRRAGREHLADEGLLRHDPGRSGRVGARRRGHALASLLGRDPAAGRAGAGGRGAALVRLHHQRVRIASALLPAKDHFTLPLGMRGFIDQKYGQHWGPFAAGALMATIPAAGAVAVPAALRRRRALGGGGQGVSLDRSSTSLVEPYHDGSEACVLERPDELGGQAVVRVLVPHEAGVDAVALRSVHDGEGVSVRAERRRRERGGHLVAGVVRRRNPTTRYRWLLAGRARLRAG